MQVFIIGSPYETAQVLDKRRMNKQIIECKQMLEAINGRKAWKNHPVVKSYTNHSEWLDLYMMCLDAYIHGKNDYAAIFSASADKIRPEFHTSEYFDHMKRRLFTKDKNYYAQWSTLGESDVNWYFVDGEWKYYKNGKQVTI